jgi:hypothetical protein
MIRLSYEDLKRVRGLRFRRRGLYGLIVSFPLLFFSYVPIYEINKLIMKVSDIIILRIAGLMGVVLSFLILWRGEEILRGLGPFAEAKRLNEELGEVCKVFENIMRGRWR